MLVTLKCRGCHNTIELEDGEYDGLPIETWFREKRAGLCRDCHPKRQTTHIADHDGLVRNDHPETARAAAKQAKTGSGKLCQKLLALIRDADGMTDEELQHATGMNPNTERPRRRELVTGGYITKSDRTRKTASGREAIIWEALPEHQ